MAIRSPVHRGSVGWTSGWSPSGHAHDALLRLSSATSAAAAVEDFIWCHFNESPRWEGWRSAARQLVQDARRSLGEAKDAVRLMRDAVLCEFFETWTILRRA